MGFIESYKHLEKICGEILNDDRRVSAYIDEMMNTPLGAFYVLSWKEDLKKLKHYRWVRNRIAHEPGCNEENMCDPSDVQWLDDFYDRIMNQTDPLTLYRKATEAPEYTDRPSNTHRSLAFAKALGCAGFLLLIALIIVIVIFFLR